MPDVLLLMKMYKNSDLQYRNMQNGIYKTAKCIDLFMDETAKKNKPPVHVEPGAFVRPFKNRAKRQDSFPEELKITGHYVKIEKSMVR